MRLEPLNITLDGAVPIPAAVVFPPRGVRQAELLAILDAGPIGVDDLAFMSRHRRTKALISIETLIDMLDAIDDDPDLEETADDELTGDEAEPSLGAPEVEFNYRGLPERHGHINQKRWCDGAVQHGECEPSLGSVEPHYWRRDQREWSLGYQRDPSLDECETVSEDEGACIQSHPHDGHDVQDACTVDDMSGEHSLGWSEQVDQRDLGVATDDAEPSLGSQEPVFSASGRVYPDTASDAYPEAPYRWRSADGNQDAWSHGNTSDLEEVNEEGTLGLEMEVLA